MVKSIKGTEMFQSGSRVHGLKYQLRQTHDAYSVAFQFEQNTPELNIS